MGGATVLHLCICMGPRSVRLVHLNYPYFCLTTPFMNSPFNTVSRTLKVNSIATTQTLSYMMLANRTDILAVHAWSRNNASRLVR
jgi:hypothetical protein